MARHGLRALQRQAGGEQHRVLLGDAHVVVALGKLALEDVEPQCRSSSRR